MSDTAYDFAEETADLEGAEDFLDYFQIPYEPSVVHVCRLHILQRFHDYLLTQVKPGESGFTDYRRQLIRAYEDFVHSDAQTEKVFSVLKRAAGIATVPITAIRRAGSTGAA
jgi:nitrogenase-stabilizing/protective protein